MQSPCYKCVHKIEIAGDCHTGCNNAADAKPERKTWRGCGIWPLKFDPNTVFSCNGFSADPTQRKPQNDDPLLAIARLLA